jgi:uncharacterized protein
MRILAIDGGGIRGLIPALVLAEIEQRTGKRIAELFDRIAGTSTGGILACALAKPDPLPAEQIAGIYVDEGPKIFHRSLLKTITSVDGYLDERYDDHGLMDALRRYLGDTKLGEATIPILVTAYDIEGRDAISLRSDVDRDVTMVEAARGTSAAPTYFEPVRVEGRALVDGGVFAINPAMIAYALAAGKEIDVLASCGTGVHTRKLPLKDVKGWGKLEWAQPIIDVVFDGIADTVNEQLTRLAGDRYIRLQTPLDEASDNLDDASPENLAALRREAERLIQNHEVALDRLCSILTS